MAPGKPKEKVEYTRPTSQIDLEQRQEADKEAPQPLFVAVNPQPTESDEPYAGTDVIYQNHANDTEAPLLAEEGPEQVAEEAYLNSFEPSEEKKKAVADQEANKDEVVTSSPIVPSKAPVKPAVASNSTFDDDSGSSFGDNK